MRLITGLETANLRLGVIGGLLTLGLIGTIVPDVIARNFLDVALYGMSEAGVMVLVFVVFLSLPAAQVNLELYRVSAYDHLLSTRAKRIMDALRYALSAAICAGVAYYSILGAVDSTLRNEATYTVVPFPVWPGRISVAIGTMLLAIQFIADFVRSVSGAERASTEHEPSV